MLEHLKFHGVGPAPELEVTLRRRLNLLTGDNGLGKTFLLDVAWWALTRTWARRPAVPRSRPPAPARIGYRYEKKTGGSVEFESKFDRALEEWPLKPSRPAIPGLVIYAQVDGAFSVWDPHRNYWKKENPSRPASYLFTADEVWEGNAYCEGLIRDWASWQREGKEAFKQLTAVLVSLSPSPRELLEPGELRRISIGDPKDHPTLRMPYGEDVALVHASAGMRRVVALAYLLVWTWQEHLAACEVLGKNPEEEIVFLIDEIEAHLHPSWQRRIVPALLGVMHAITGENSTAVQLITATHSPLVLASVEPLFDTGQDGLFQLELDETQTVSLREVSWAKQGDVVNWLVSDTFGLKQGRSLEAEVAIEAAEAWMRGDEPSLPAPLSTQDAIDAELRRVLPGHDVFWPRWVVWVEAGKATVP